MWERWLPSLWVFIGLALFYNDMMVYRILLLFSALLLHINAQAQEKPNHGGWFAGMHGGAVLNDMANSSFYFQFDNKTSVMAGGLIGYHFGRNMSLQLEANFERRAFNTSRYVNGLRLTDTSNYVCWQCYYDFNVDYVSDYLSFPLLFNYARMQKKLTFGVQAGLYYAILLVNNHDGKETYYLDPVGAAPFLPSFEPGTFTTVYSGASANIMNTYDTGLILGIFVKYAILPEISVTADARVISGFTGIYENPQMPVINFKGFSFRAGLQYGFIK